MVSGIPFRFVHAAGLRLDDVCTGVDELPGEFQHRLIDARLRAASRLFDTAIREQAACIVLAGDLFTCPEKGRHGAGVGSFRAATFLIEQCRRLASHHITVYWGDGEESPIRQWPTALPMPVNLVPVNSQSESRLVTRSGATVLIRQTAAINSTLKWGVAGDETRSAFRILLVPGTNVPAFVTHPATSTESPCDYIACGGSQGPSRISTSFGTAIASGTTQGNSPCDTGMRGCVVVDVRADQTVGIRFVETASIHWHLLQTGIDDATGWDSLRAYLHAQTAALTEGSAAEIVLMRWDLCGHGTLFERLMRPDVRSLLRAETLRVLRELDIPVYCLNLNAIPDAIQQTRWLKGEETGAYAKVLDELFALDQPTIDVRKLLPAAELEVDAATLQIPEPHFLTKVQPTALQRGIRAIADRKK